MPDWKELTTTQEWSHWYAQSKKHPVFIFKHSTRCPVSADALQEFESFLAEDAPKETAYLVVKVIESREVSNRIAADLDIKHQSPQAILLRDGVPTWDRSHWHITQDSLKEAFTA